MGREIDRERERGRKGEREREENRTRNIVELDRIDHWRCVSLGGLFFFCHWLTSLGRT